MCASVSARQTKRSVDTSAEGVTHLLILNKCMRVVNDLFSLDHHHLSVLCDQLLYYCTDIDYGW